MIDTIAQTLQHYVKAAREERAIHAAVIELARLGHLPFIQHEFTLEDIATSKRIDFYFPDLKIGLECKTSGSTGDVVRQLYTYEPYVAGLILLTTKRHEIGQELFDKPFRQVVPFYA